MLDQRIASDFRMTSKFTIDSEVDLFRKLAASIARNSASVFVDETHGASKCNVKFDLTTGSETRCEISDLLIVSRSRNSQFLRATFWQAKKQAHSKWVSQATSENHLDFSGQFNQWDLLSRRPPIRGVPPFVPPGDLLSGFDSPSIGSFGIFYERASQIDVFHSVAEFVACSNPTVSHPTMVGNGRLERYSIYGQEVIVRSSLESFLQALFNHQIGARLEPENESHNWLISYAASRAAASGQPIPEGFFEVADVDQSYEFTGGPGNLSVLLVDAEGASR